MSTQQFADLFQGRRDAWGAVHGECIHEDLTLAHFERHLNEPGHSLGVYPLESGDAMRRNVFQQKHGFDGGAHYVKWGCSDIDNGDDLELAWTLARNLHTVLRALGIESWIERSKGKGYHVWVFADEWVPAIVMRRAFLFAHQVAGVTATEVNPKSLDGGKTGIGNYVNLPYAFDWRDTDKRTMVVPSDGGSIPLTWFLEHVKPNSFEQLRSVAAKWKEPERKKVGQVTEPSVEASELARCLNGLAYKVWREGPMEGRDRSTAMARFCHLCADQGIAAGTTLVLLRDMDARLGKFVDREDREEQLLRLVENAYA